MKKLKEYSVWIFLISTLFLFIGLIIFCIYLLLNKTKPEINTTENNPIISDSTVEEYKDFLTFKTLSPIYLNSSDKAYSYDDGNYKSILIADISKFDSDIDFNELKNIGVEGVMIRVLWRGYTEGGIYIDELFEEHYKNAKAAGLKVGYYVFSQALNEDEAKQEADILLANIENRDCDLFICYDYESPGAEEGRIHPLTKEERTKHALYFCDYIKEKGYKPIVYANNDWALNYYDIETIASSYPVWYAQYTDSPDFPVKVLLWQYTDSYKMEGVSKPIDMNLMLVKK